MSTSSCTCYRLQVESFAVTRSKTHHGFDDPGSVTLRAELGDAGDDPLSTHPIGASATTRRMIPPRYQRRDDDDGPYLTCTEAPNVSVRIERGFVVTGAMARKYPEHSLFVDGAAQGEPFMDVSRRIYNLDHHEGCVRAFTLATCEQAMVMVLKGLDLDAERWTVYANEPDLDTVLAIWVLLNHRRLGDGENDLRTRVMPLVRLQGAIDAHGFDLAELTGFPEPLQRETLSRIESLRADEIARKAEGTWTTSDPLDYAAGVLAALDEMMYRAADFADASDVEELERVPLGGDRFAVLCRSASGIYEVEQQLRDVHGERVGLVLLEREPFAWTVRQVDPFLPVPLSGLYDRLNLVDPHVVGHNRWGGSEDIGGSPRTRGTGLDARAIAAVCRWVYRPPGTAARVRAVASAAVLGLAAVAVALALAGLATPGTTRMWPLQGLWSSVRGSAVFSVSLTVVAWALVMGFGRRMPRLTGLRRPTGGAWTVFAIPLAVGAAGGGAWVALTGATGAGVGWWSVVWVALGAASAEVIFRGVVEGRLARVFRIMTPGGERFVSVPVAVSAVLSAIATLLLFPGTPLLAEVVPVAATSVAGVAALVVGLAAGAIRERSGSVWVAAASHAAIAAATWFAVAGVP
jgi:hypothetical protein